MYRTATNSHILLSPIFPVGLLLIKQQCKFVLCLLVNVHVKTFIMMITNYNNDSINSQWLSLYAKTLAYPLQKS